jgi:hypothetical protein
LRRRNRCETVVLGVSRPQPGRVLSAARYLVKYKGYDAEI